MLHLWTSKGRQVSRKAALHGSAATGHRTQGPEVPQAAQRQAAIEAEMLQGHLGAVLHAISRVILGRYWDGIPALN